MARGDGGEAARILRTFRRLVVVGCSQTPGKDAHDVPRFMMERGYDVVPVNPNASEVLGRPSYPTVLDVPPELRAEPFAVVVFRPSAETPGVARRAVEAGAGALWLQLGIAHPEAERVARGAGIPYVEDECVMVVHLRHVGGR